MKYIRLTMLTLSIVLPLSIRAATVGGVQIPDRVESGVEKVALQLNGAGLRKKFFFNVYVAALYLPKPENDAAKLLASPPRNRILMHFVYRKVDKQKMDDTWREGFARSAPSSRLDAMTGRLDRFIDMFGDMREGDEVWLDYEPERGTLVSINGELKGVVKGSDFNRALLGIWLGDEPISDALKNEMVGVDK